jgi:hypothetical protein
MQEHVAVSEHRIRVEDYFGSTSVSPFGLEDVFALLYKLPSCFFSRSKS